MAVIASTSARPYEHVDGHHVDGDRSPVGCSGDVQRHLYHDRGDRQTGGERTEHPVPAPQQHGERQRRGEEEKRCGDCDGQPQVVWQWCIADRECHAAEAQQENTGNGAQRVGGVQRTPPISDPFFLPASWCVPLDRTKPAEHRDRRTAHARAVATRQASGSQGA